MTGAKAAKYSAKQIQNKTKKLAPPKKKFDFLQKYLSFQKKCNRASKMNLTFNVSGKASKSLFFGDTVLNKGGKGGWGGRES